MAPGAAVADFDVGRLRVPSSMTIYGPSQSGKTTFVEDLISRCQALYGCKISPRYFFYRAWGPAYERLERDHNVQFLKRPVNTEWILENIPPPDSAERRESGCVPLVISDDYNDFRQEDSDIWCAQVHHRKFIMITILHELYGRRSGSILRTISLNSSYIVLHKYVRDMTIAQALGRQFDPNNVRRYVNIYKDATSKPYGYLFLDLTNTCPDYARLRSNVLFEGGQPLCIYERLSF